MIGSGLSSSMGLAPEDVYGTYKAPTRFLELAGSPSLKMAKNPQVSKGLAAGRQVPLASRRVVTSRAGGGSLPIEVANKGMGRLLNALIGGTVAPVQQAATAAYLQTHTLSATQDVAGKMLTIQAGVPDTAGVVHPYSFLGSKVLSIEFSCGIDEMLTATVEVDSRDVVEDQILAAPSYVLGTRPFHFAQAALKVGDTVAAAAQVSGVRKMSLKIARKMDTGRFYFGAGGLKDEPLLNDFCEITGTIESDLVDKATFADRYRDDEQTALVWEFVGPTIEGAHAETIRFALPASFFNGETPSPSGPGVVSTSFGFEVLNDGVAAPATIEYISTDATL